MSVFNYCKLKFAHYIEISIYYTENLSGLHIFICYLRRDVNETSNSFVAFSQKFVNACDNAFNCTGKRSAL